MSKRSAPRPTGITVTVRNVYAEPGPGVMTYDEARYLAVRTLVEVGERLRFEAERSATANASAPEPLPVAA